MIRVCQMDDMKTVCGSSDNQDVADEVTWGTIALPTEEWTKIHPDL